MSRGDTGTAGQEQDFAAGATAARQDRQHPERVGAGPQRPRGAEHPDQAGRLALSGPRLPS